MGILHNRTRQTPTRQRLRTHGTPAEAKLWSLLQNRQVCGHRFQRQFGIGPYILDFYCRAARLGVEVDGAIHADPARSAYDQTRTDALARLGVRILRFENRRVFDAPEAVAAEIAGALRA